jgi:hypothetical protein
MKKSVLILIFALMFACVYGQNSQGCYGGYRSKGIAAYNGGKYEEAKKYFAAILSGACPDDTPANHDVNSWVI